MWIWIAFTLIDVGHDFDCGYYECDGTGDSFEYDGHRAPDGEPYD